MIVVTYYIK
jgi:hypothetical protein